MQQTALLLHTFIKKGARIRRENVESGSLDSLLHDPFHGALENRFVVLIHAKNKAAVHHHAGVVDALDGVFIAAVEILKFALVA